MCVAAVECLGKCGWGGGGINCKKGEGRKVADNGFGMDPCSVIMIKVKKEKGYTCPWKGGVFFPGVSYFLWRE